MSDNNSTASIVPPYGAVIQEAMKRNDPAELARVAAQAQDYLAHAEEVKAELAKLNAHISGSASIVPYGDAIQEAIKSGDRARMEQVAAAAEAHLQRASEIREALGLLRAEIDKG